MFVFTVGMLMTILAVLINGLCIMLGWNWFIIPLHAALPTLTYGGAIGASLFITLINARVTKHLEVGELVTNMVTYVFTIILLITIAFIFKCIIY